jgi:hypothetical protein
MNTADTYARCLLIIAAFSIRLNDYKITPSIAAGAPGTAPLGRKLFIDA